MSLGLLLTQNECEKALHELEKLFKPRCFLTLLMRDPESPEGYLIFTKDDLAKVEETIRHIREKE